MKNMSLSEMITYSTVLIRCEYANGTKGSGTGFIVNLCNDERNHTCIPVLITNDHVVASSIRTVFEFCKADENGDPIDTLPFSFTYEGNAWIHHPDKEVDLCCLLLAEALNRLKENNIKIFYVPLETNVIPSNDQLSELSAVEEVLMFGYPIGLSDTYNHKPIVRRGITASHPNKDYQGKKEILVDMACYPGSSGSPVFILNQGSYVTPNGLFVGNRVYLLGILFSSLQYDTKGTLQISILPNAPVPITPIHINLGVMIKSARIIEFEKILRRESEGEKNG